jgi:hypothetical protein
MSTPSMQRPENGCYIAYRVVKNRMFSWSNFTRPEIPITVRQHPIGNGLAGSMPMPFYNLDAVHYLALPDCTVKYPPRRGEDDEFYESLKAEARRQAIEKRQACRTLANEVRAFIKSGTIELVEDPTGLLGDTETQSATATKAKKRNE